MLKSLEIGGFKSFAKKTDLQFKSKVTAIVGPNGSGKSNVAEAFRFVLGEQSIKSMRGKRGEDLIWNGSTETPRTNRGSVKLVFDNQDKKLNIDFDEVTIERVVHRDGGNEYLVNGTQVRLKDIFELLTEAHIGASGHHIISQGEADRILRASTKERREMIEDALGLKIYQYKREESERKLEKTEENARQVESLRREIAPHLRFLKKQVEKIEKAEEVRVLLINLYREYLKREKIYIENQEQIIATTRKPLEHELNRLEKAMNEAKHILETSLSKDKKSTELLQIETDIQAARHQKDSLGREIGKIEGEIVATERRLQTIRLENTKQENKTVLLRDIENLEREISVLSDLKSVFNKIRAFIDTYKETKDDREERELTSTIERLEKTKTNIEREATEVDANLLKLNDKYQGIKISIEKEKDSERDAEKAIFKIASEESEVRGKLAILERERERVRLINEDWKREIKEGGVLLGSAITGFELLPLYEDEVLKEERNIQEERRRELEKMKIRLEELGGQGGTEVMKEYKETLERDAYLEKELQDLYDSSKSLQKLIEELAEKLNDEFKSGVSHINKNFQKYFELMFGGGQAELKTTSPAVKLKTKKTEENLMQEEEEKEEKSEEGIDIAISLPHKKLRSLDMLSGGERALTSIALLFAIASVNPPPFIILDETDAALDEANSKKYGDAIQKLSEHSQLILITHNRETMSRAGVIYGVTMGKDSVSRVLSIEFDEAVSVAK